MSEKNKNIELKIYEMLGVKKFRKLAFMLRKVILFPVVIFVPKEYRNEIYNSADNYNMRKGNGIKDLKDFKKMILLNTFLHIMGILVCIPNFLNVINGVATISTTIINLTCILANCYCLMLQRYTNIKINKVIKKWELRDSKRKVKLKEELIKEDSLLNEYNYKIINKHHKEKNTTFDGLLEGLTYNQLKQFRDSLLYLKDIEFYQDCCKLENPCSVNIPIEKRKILEFKPRNENLINIEKIK